MHADPVKSDHVELVQITKYGHPLKTRVFSIDVNALLFLDVPVSINMIVNGLNNYKKASDNNDKRNQLL